MTDKTDEKLGEDTPSPEPFTGNFFKEIDVAFLVHELKDPIAVIESGIRTLLERPEKFGPLSPRQERTLERSLRNSRKARRVLNELLEIGRGEAGCFITGLFRPADAAWNALVEAVESHSEHLANIIARNQKPEGLAAMLRGEGIIFEVTPIINKYLI